ncbi:5-methylcytosine rRNA methyltransferase NSUN4 [Hylaeus volcanicus]|uniref:5-methylcytosine rRNA methyltransferase NSUN4 n=1 Tax=Hylaeus volcanicus TaxID=313075 RepID=UPI0023B826CF|nr:5-methylcytosine rRNA methyltransferase NSUN4 [Hylaeus volcanicus]XP_053973836.1 5-methylcytosine rRNA methyltransferase NSUN4 [Hylaeus volcanicus]XP_053973844.1 5-methylcytosine rRNA methyltransferase NSUN4 [Hylaeus volcanicus]
MALLVNKLRLGELVKVSVRYKNGPNHWSVLRKKKTAKDKALQHFDEFYGSVYGDNWQVIRAALLKEESKYIAVVNNFSDTERIKSDLELLGAFNLKVLYNVFNETIAHSPKSETIETKNDQSSIDTFISNIKSTEVESIYPADHEHVPKELTSEENEELITTQKPLQSIQLQSINKDLNEVAIETNRIIDSSKNLSLLHEYIPATKIKGLDDWVLESNHYDFYNKAPEFKVHIVKEYVLSFPKHLHAYTFEAESKVRFPNPKRGTTGVLDYYLFDGGSILPILALDLQLGDIVLDMCAAPGGKALTILQTLLPKVVVANDKVESRVNRINNVMEQYVLNLCDEQSLFVTEQDARAIDEKDIYNKILVDVPCTTDRHVLHSDENNMFKPSRLKERLQIPELQSEILTNALKLVSVGGIVVYATCSLSPIQNDGVVHVALKKAWEESDSVMIVKDMTEALSPLKCIYRFGDIDLKYGHIVVPSLGSNWGPMYFCKIVRVR